MSEEAKSHISGYVILAKIFFEKIYKLLYLKN